MFAQSAGKCFTERFADSVPFLRDSSVSINSCYLDKRGLACMAKFPKSPQCLYRPFWETQMLNLYARFDKTTWYKLGGAWFSKKQPMGKIVGGV